MTDILKLANASPADPYFRLETVKKDGDTMLMYPGLFATANEAHRLSSQPPTGALAQYGDTATWELDKNGFQIGKIWLHVQRSALTLGAGAAAAAFVDAEGFAMIDKVEISQGANDLERRLTDQYYLERSQCREKQEDKDFEAPLILADLSFLERATGTVGGNAVNGTASTVQDLYVNLSPWWDKWTKMYPMTSILGAKLTIKVTLKNLTDITTWDAGSVPTCTIRAMDLVYMTYYVPKDEQALNTSKVMVVGGLQYRTMQWTQQSRVYPSGTTTMQLQLQNFKLPCVEFFFHVRLTGDMNSQATGSYADKSYTNFLEWTDFKLDSGDLEIVKTQTARFNIHAYKPTVHAIPETNYIGNWSFSWTPDNAGASTGHKTWSEMTNPTITINLPDPGAEAILTVFSRENNIVIHKAGSMKRLLS